MSRPRFVVPSLPRAGDRTRLPEEEAAHARARRLSVGDAVVLIDGSGAQAQGSIARLGRSTVEVEVAILQPAGDRGPAIWLGVAAVRSERISWIAEKAGELAVAALVLVRSERTQSFRAGATALIPRLERLVREAAKQSGETRWPRCEGPLELEQALARGPGPSRFFIDSSGDSFPSSIESRSASILVGPEGGWTEGERESARQAGWSVIRLPAATLRTETAAIAGVVLARAAMEE